MQKYIQSIILTIGIIILFVALVMYLKPNVVKTLNISKNIKEQTLKESDLRRQLEDLKKAEMSKMKFSLQTKKIYKPEIPGLNTESSFTIMFDDIIDIMKYNGIKIYSIKYTYNPAEDEFVKGAPEKYNVCQLDMEIIGDYNDLESFLKELYKYPYLVNVTKIELKPYMKNKRILIAALQIKLYSTK